ncbi:MAG: transglycosylase family protein [Culicoidibacterales bacterium]
MLSNKIGKVSIFAVKSISIIAITLVAALGMPLLQKQMVVSVDGLERTITVDGLYAQKLKNNLSYGTEGEDFIYDQEVNPDAFLTDVAVIAISTKKIVKIIDEAQVKDMKTYVHTLDEFLAEAGIKISKPDVPLVTKVSNSAGSTALQSITTLEHNLKEDEVQVESRENPELELGKEIVVQQGQAKKTKEIFLTDSTVTKKLLSSEVVTPAVTTIIEKGTKVEPPKPNAPAVPSDSVWDKLAFCESGGRWNINTGNGYYGGVQFSAPTWRTASKKVGLNIPYASDATREEQILAATWLQKNSGWGQWPSCSKKLGLL